MKKQLLRASAIFIFVITMAAVSVSAQSDERRIVVDIPFDFVVEKRTLPAGVYTIKSISSNSDKILLIRSADGRQSALANTNAVEASAAQKRSKLIFQRYGDQYFLSQVWSRGGNVGRELPRSDIQHSLEREMTKSASSVEVATKRPEPQTVTLIGRER
jgi:hypothetical protein